jgi:hypothetical protein
MAAVHSLHLHARTMDAHTDHHQGLRVPLTPTSPVEVVGLLLAISLLRASSVHRHAGLPPGAERRRIPETSPRPNLFFSAALTRLPPLCASALRFPFLPLTPSPLSARRLPHRAAFAYLSARRRSSTRSQVPSSLLLPTQARSAVVAAPPYLGARSREDCITSPSRYKIVRAEGAIGRRLFSWFLFRGSLHHQQEGTPRQPAGSRSVL